MPGGEIGKCNRSASMRLGVGINTLTATILPPVMDGIPDEVSSLSAPALGVEPASVTKSADLASPLPVEKKTGYVSVTTTPNRTIDTTQDVHTSLKSLLEAINGSVGFPIDIVEISGQLSKSTQSSANDVFVMLKKRCTEETIAFTESCSLKRGIIDKLLNRQYDELRTMYGDAMVGDVTRGRFALVLIRFHLKSTEEQVALSASLSSKGPISANATIFATAGQSSAEKKYSLYTYSEGMRDPSAGIFSDEGDISSYIKQICVEDSRSLPSVPIAWSSVPFSAIAPECCMKQALEFESYVAKARTLYQSITAALQKVDGYLLYFYALNESAVNPKWVLSKGVENRVKQVEKLHALRKNLLKIAGDVDENACNPQALESYTSQFKLLLGVLDHAHNTFPDKFDLPVTQIFSEQIRNISHKHGEDEFALKFPTEASTLWVQIRSVEERNYQAQILSTQALADCVQEFDEAIKNGLASLDTKKNYDKNIAKMKFQLSIAMSTFKRAEKMACQIHEDEISLEKDLDREVFLGRIKNGVELAKKITEAMASVESAFDVLARVQQGIPQRETIALALSNMDVMRAEVNELNHTLNDGTEDSADPIKTKLTELAPIKTILEEDISPELVKLSNTEGITSIKKDLDTLFKQEMADALDTPIKISILQDLAEAERCVTQLLWDKIKLGLRLEQCIENGDLNQQHSLIDQAEIFYRAAAATKLALQQAQKNLQGIISCKGTSTPLGIIAALAQLAELQSVVEKVECTQHAVTKPVVKAVFCPYLACMEKELIAARANLCAIQRETSRRPAPPMSNAKFKLKEHLYSDSKGFFASKGAPRQETRLSVVGNATRIPAGKSFPHVYAKPVRKGPALFFPAQDLPKGTTVDFYAQVFPNKAS